MLKPYDPFGNPIALPIDLGNYPKLEIQTVFTEAQMKSLPLKRNMGS